MDCCVQRRRPGILQLRCRSLSDGDHAARLRGDAHWQETGMGRSADARQECPRGVPVRPAQVSRRLEAVVQSLKSKVQSSERRELGMSARALSLKRMGGCEYCWSE